MNNLQEKVIRAMVDMYGFYSIEELSEMTNISVSSIKHSLGILQNRSKNTEPDCFVSQEKESAWWRRIKKGKKL